MTKELLTLRGYHALTHPYKMPDEDLALSRAVAQLVKGNVLHVLLWSEENDNVEIWSLARVPPVPEDAE